MLFPRSEVIELSPGALLLRGAAEPFEESLLAEIQLIITKAPLRTVMTPMGRPMSVEMTNCGDLGWVSDRKGYRYENHDPITSRPWPKMPTVFRDLARRTAKTAGYTDFTPDVCLINRYSVGSKMGLHQDRDEKDFSQPIVSVSLGLPIIFQFGGTMRNDAKVKVELHHGDVVVFGGKARLAFHGVGTLRRGSHPLTQSYRINLTFRRS
jgi:alkylated DNA repair protein (DNA oxidative demethylase)